MTLIDPTIFTNRKPINNNETPDVNSPESLSPVDRSPFRRIEFQVAKKPFTRFANGCGDGSFRLEMLNPNAPSSKSGSGSQLSVGSGSGLGKKRDASEMENGLDSELSLGITFKRIGAGLENLGNTCFLNSVLQCLTYTEPLAAYLQSGKHQVTCRKSGFCALCAIQKHVSRALQLSGRSLAPKDFVSNLRCISRTFRNSRQEDAHEYMVNLLESMHKCCLPNGVPSESQSAYDWSLVHKIFGGRLRSQVKCMQCNFCSNKFDPFLDLSLEILKADNLYKAFSNFTAKEHLDGGAKQYQCQECKQKVKALKQLTIHKAPNVLTVHLKRFDSHMSGQKIDKRVHFGSTLDLKPFVTDPNEGDLKYTLYGVLVHAGWSTHSGHYYCFVRTSSGMWYSLDDNRVYQVSEKKVFEQKAYMLFYFKDRKNFPSKKTTSDVLQKEKIVMNGTVNGPGAAKEAQLKMGQSNGSINGHKAFTAVGTDRNGVSPVAPKEPQIKTCPNNGPLSGHKPFGSEGNGINPVAPKEAQMEMGLSNGSVNGQNSLANVNIEISGLSPVAPKETQTNTNLSNESSNSHKSAVTVCTVKNASSTSVPEQTQKKEGPVLKSISESTFESSLNDKNSDSCVENSKPIDTPVDTASKTEKAIKEIGIGESSGGNNSGDGEIKEAPTALLQSSCLPKMESSAEIKASGKKARKKVKNFLKCKGISMKFSSNALIGSLLNQRKKKKHKQSKRVKNLSQETSVNEGTLSVKTEPQVAVKPFVENGFEERVKTPVENGFKEEVNKDVAVLATTDFNAVSIGTQSEPTGPSRLDGCMGASTQKDLVHMLTRGMDDRIIPRWDEDDSTPSQRREKTRNLKIGYIGDEWDEEYDRGKRKKVRMSQTEFDGKNPFQSIANERLKTHADKQNLSKRPQPSTMTKNNHFKTPRSSNNHPHRI